MHEMFLHDLPLHAIMKDDQKAFFYQEIMQCFFRFNVVI